MDLDFTHAKYRELCEVISKSEYTPLTVEKYLLLKDKPLRLCKTNTEKGCIYKK